MVGDKPVSVKVAVPLDPDCDPDIASQRRPPEGCVHPYTVVSDSGLAMVTTIVAMFAVTVPVATLVIAGTVGLVVVVSEE